MARECPGAAQVLHESVSVVAAEHRIQRPLVRRLRQQLADVAVVVRLRRPTADRTTGQASRGVDAGLAQDVGVGVGVNEYFDRHCQLPAVVQRRVELRDPGRPGVHVLVLGEAGDLEVPVQVRLPSAAAHRPVSAARTVPGLEDLTAVPGLLQLVGRRQAGDARAEHQDRGVVDRAAQVEVGGAGRPERSGVPPYVGSQAEHVHGGKRRARPSHGSEHAKESPPAHVLHGRHLVSGRPGRSSHYTEAADLVPPPGRGTDRRRTA